jgi:hypothetical protein
MRMRLLRFKFTAEYVAGKDLKDADCLSRAPVENPTRADESLNEEVAVQVNMIIQSMPATDNRIEEIVKATENDTEMQEIINYITQGWPSSVKDCDNVKEYWKVREDLTYIKGLILKGNRIVIPSQLRQKLLVKLHEGHLGMEKCKRRARESIYWPGLSTSIEQMVRRCHTCQQLLPSKGTEPMIPHTIPTQPWQKVGSDLFQYNNKHYLIIADYYSLFPEVYLLTSTKAKDIVNITKDVFARHGIPEEIITDNGPQYKCREYRQFSEQWEFTHTTSSPHYPQSNGFAESMVKVVKQLIKKCHRSNQDITKGLLLIRNTSLKCGNRQPNSFYETISQESLSNQK